MIQNASIGSLQSKKEPYVCMYMLDAYDLDQIM